MFENIFIICFFVLLITSIILAYKLYQFSILILSVEDSIEDCIDVLNERYDSISKILEKEVFFDSIEVRQVIADIQATQHALLGVANTLTKDIRKIENNDDNQSKKED